MIKRTLAFTSPARLNLRNGQMVVTLPELEGSEVLPLSIRKESERTIPVEDIGIVLLEHPRITVTSGLLEALLENGSAVVTCDSRCLPNGLLLPLSGNTLQSERFRFQIDASLPLRKQLWAQTVQKKILGQASVLEQCSDAEAGCMRVWAKNVRSGDPDNLEGRAAVYYWRHVFSQIPDFIRDREGLPPNNMLNYGYAILRAVVARALVGSGLLPTLGIHHHNRYNAYCLADDIMEPYRPFVDRLVISVLEKYGCVDNLTREIKFDLLSIPTLDVVISGKRSPLMLAVSQTTASLYRCFAGEQKLVEYPEL